MLKFRCACGQKIGAPDEHAGHEVRCPKCGNSVVAAAAASPPPIPQVPPNQSPAAIPHTARKSAIAITASIVVACLAAFAISQFKNAVHSKRTSVYSWELTGNEKFLCDGIKAGDPDLVRSALAGKIDWAHAATPALKELMSYDRLSDSREGAFWVGVANRLIENGANASSAMSDASDIASLRFLSANGADVNAANEVGDSPIMRFSGQDFYADRVEFLISRGANVNFVGFEGNTPLHAACQKNAAAMARRLIGAGANTNQKNKAGQTPLDVANLTLSGEAAAVIRSSGGK